MCLIYVSMLIVKILFLYKYIPHSFYDNNSGKQIYRHTYIYSDVRDFQPHRKRGTSVGFGTKTSWGHISTYTRHVILTEFIYFLSNSKMRVIRISTEEMQAALNSLTFAKTVGMNNSLCIVGVQMISQEITVFCYGRGNFGGQGGREDSVSCLKLIDSTTVPDPRIVSRGVEPEKQFQVETVQKLRSKGHVQVSVGSFSRDSGMRRRITALESTGLLSKLFAHVCGCLAYLLK